MAEGRYDDLARDLVALGRAIDPPVSTDRLATSVMDRVAVLPPPGQAGTAWTRLRLRIGDRVAEVVESIAPRGRIALVVVAVLVGLLAAPPVRATVADWFGFAGVVVERGPSGQGPAPPPPQVPPDRSLSEADAAVGFRLLVPAELGVPDGVEVSPDRRAVAMSWATDEDGVLRLDQFDARLDFYLLKRAPGVSYAAVDGSDALWFEEPHEVALLEPDGSPRTESARLAGHTLIWPVGLTTLRLEGEVSLARAVEIAESMVPVD